MRISDWSSDVCSSDLTRRLRPVRRRRDGRRHPHRTRLKKRSNILEHATYEIRAGGIALVTIDMKGSPVNAMNDAFSAMLDEVLVRLAADKASIAGVILTSAKNGLVAGGVCPKNPDRRSPGDRRTA